MADKLGTGIAGDEEKLKEGIGMVVKERFGMPGRDKVGGAAVEDKGNGAVGADEDKDEEEDEICVSGAIRGKST